MAEIMGIAVVTISLAAGAVLIIWRVRRKNVRK